MRRFGAVVLAVLLAADGVIAASLAFLVVSSLVGNENDDPHGYALIFGIVGLLVVVPVGLMLLASLRHLAARNRQGQLGRET